MKAPSVAVLLAVAATILCLPATANAITLTSHVEKPHGITGKADRHVVLVRTVAPPDRDDDGCANADDSYNGPGCNEPAPVAQPVSEPIAPTPTTTSVATTTAGACGGVTPYEGGGQCWAIPYSIVSCESGGQDIPNSEGSGAEGYYQLMEGGTGDKASQDAAAASLWDGGAGASAWVCAG